MLELCVQRRRNRIRVAIGELLDSLEPAFDAENLFVDSQHRLQMAILVGNLWQA